LCVAPCNNALVLKCCKSSALFRFHNDIGHIASPPRFFDLFGSISPFRSYSGVFPRGLHPETCDSMCKVSSRFAGNPKAISRRPTRSCHHFVHADRPPESHTGFCRFCMMKY
jgi:hypothetical protein